MVCIYATGLLAMFAFTQPGMNMNLDPATRTRWPLRATDIVRLSVTNTTTPSSQTTEVSLLTLTSVEPSPSFFTADMPMDHSMMIMPSGTDVPIDPSTTEPATDVSGAIKKHFSASLLAIMAAGSIVIYL